MHVGPENWSNQREELKRRVLEILGPFPTECVDLSPRVVDEVQCQGYVRRKVLYQTQPGEDVPAYLMVPDGLDGPRPVAFCIHPTTKGSGKDRIAGLAGIEPGTPPDASRSYAHELAQRGYVVLAPDFLTDGERVYPGWEPYHTLPFYEANPEWSAVGKNIWDAMRGIDYLQTIPEADCSRIATIGHSFGGHHAIFIAALDDRVACVAANGGAITWWLNEKLGWARPLDSWYTYINKLRPYLERDDRQVPFEFSDFTALVAPRPLLSMSAEGDGHPVAEMEATARGAMPAWHALGAGDKVLFTCYPGPHDFTQPVRDMAYAWLHRWLSYPGREVLL